MANSIELPPVAPGKGVKVNKNARLDRVRFQWLSVPLLLPAGILLAAFLAPIGYSAYIGFTNLSLIGPNSVNWHFTGMHNVQAMWRDDLFGKSVYLTIIFVIFSGAVASTAVGLLIAMLMQRAIPSLRSLIGTIVVLATTLPPTTVAVIWWTVTSHGGIFSEMLGMGDTGVLYTVPMLVVSCANCWSLCGLAMLLFAAALKNVPEDIVEAAKLEGASSARIFRRVVFPVLRPTVLTSALLMTLLSFGNFTIIYIMTGGGPQDATNILPVYSYMEGFTFHRLGYGAMLGNVIVLITAAIGIIFGAISRLESRAERRAI
ncbi:sugar ABC transporter permease [Acidisoma cellulosilytica]|uniref:Sugar ABC transporter permease n=1 Tax=Acidisoma cellulosilyticum TaxID=2802395 RepID=A0A963Z751_9PROT|nr:sugar ABC transporter permease [Acidisoma cellulosilyticum]MCB8883734.1 sugar ABC transporter permease [Acidisoma cellulosilyticum]